MPVYLTVLYSCNQLFHYLQDILGEGGAVLYVHGGACGMNFNV